MAGERLLGIDEFLLTLIVRVMYQCPAMTSAQIARLATNRSAHRVDRRKVEAILTRLAGGLVSVEGVPPSHVVRRRGGLLRSTARWSLVQVPPSSSGPDAHGAPVPAQPFPSASSGAAAATLTFREDDPPAEAIGRTA
jgi:hypothetical protein